MSFRTYQPIVEAPKLPPLAPPFPEGWQGDVRYRQPPPPARTIVHDNQESTTILKVPPLAPPFKEWWEEDSEQGPRRIPPPARTLIHDEQSSSTLLKTPPLAPPFAEGWQSDRYVKPSPPQRTTPKVEDSTSPLSTAPLAPPFAEGWQAERFVLQLRSRTIVRIEDSTTPLSTPPLALPFPEGWQADRFKLFPLGRTVFRVEDSTSPLKTPPLAGPFAEGWQSDRFKLFPLGKTVWRTEDSTSPLSLPPLAPPFKEGWQSDRAKVFPLAKTVWRTEDQFFVPAVAISAQYGWEDWARRTPPPPAKTIWRTEDASTPLSVPPLAPPFPEGWEALRYNQPTPQPVALIDRGREAPFPLFVQPALPFVDVWSVTHIQIVTWRPTDPEVLPPLTAPAPVPQGWEALRGQTPLVQQRVARREDQTIFVLLPYQPYLDVERRVVWQPRWPAHPDDPAILPPISTPPPTAAPPSQFFSDVQMTQKITGVLTGETVTGQLSSQSIKGKPGTQ